MSGSDNEQRTSLTNQQLDDLLKSWKRKGADKVATAQFCASVALALVVGFFGSSLTNEAVFYGCTTIYLAVAFFSSHSD